MLNTRLVVALAVVGCSSPAGQPPADQQPAPAVVVAAPSAPAAILQPRRRAPVREPIAAWSLTASDGSGLRLVSVEAKAVTEGPLAFTELHLRFHNPEGHVREGTFAITLPSRAAVSRFAMEEAGRFKEAEVVAKALARRAYDDFLHRGIDPAILEKAAGNQFTARVFPIPPHGTKHLVISYSQELAADGYLLPLMGLPKIDEVSVTLDVVRPDGSHQTQTLRETSWQPDRDFIGTVVTAPAVATGSLVAGTFEVEPGGAAAADRPTAITVLVDTSASRAPGFRSYLGRVRTLIDGLAARYDQLAVEIVAFDQETRSMYTGLAKDFGDGELAAFVERGAAGASDLARAVASIKVTRRIAIITDGVVTAGLDGAELVKAFGKLGPERVDVILAGGIRDDHLAMTLSRTGTRPGDVFDLDREIEPIASGFGEAVRVDVPIEVSGATWFHPHTLASLRPGTRVTVFARRQTPASSFAVSIGGSHRTVEVVQATPALIERAAARVEIDELEALLASTSDVAASARLRKDIEKRSVAARVVSTQATMLVLDTDDDYARYGIDRKALADVLVVGPHGLEQSHRTFVASKGSPRRRGRAALDSMAPGDAAGSGSPAGSGAISNGFAAGSSGFGGGGSAAAVIRSHTAVAPMVSIAMPSVASGSLDKTHIKRYLKRHVEKITYCYERELLARPQLHGVMQTQFTIGPSGRVLAATATGVDEKVAACVAGVIRSIDFPPVSDSTVVVNYPFTFRTANTRDDEPAPAVDATLSVVEQPPATVEPAQPPAPPPAPPPAVTAPPVVGTQTPPAVASPPPPIDDEPHFGSASSALDGKLARVMKAIAKQDASGALALAKTWRDEQPTDVLALIGLGEAFEARGDRAAAARAYGSIIDLYPTRADFRRFAGERLERTGATGRRLAIDTYRRAVADRPDQVTGHRLLAYALLRNGDYAGAFSAILAAVDQHPPSDRFAGAPLVFARDAGMIAAAYISRGGDRERIEQQMAKRQLALVTEQSTRFLLYWETDANDVDLHVRDAAGGHAWYSHKLLESGGELFADVTTGFGPECFEIQGAPTAGPYDLGVHYYAQGPMGYGMGLLQVVRFDGKAFSFEDHPYVIMKNQAYVSLGRTR
ncbi:MAG: hypothetical protein H6Q90_799 [Deltaproteobacteria bacterium]|nr:hypothetical protein [Deltaproteobacteria bacterium]